MARTEEHTPEQIIAALKKTKGAVYNAASTLGVAPTTVYLYIKKYPEIQDFIDSERGKKIDVAEDKLFEAVKKGEAWAITFMLKTIGRDRGYTEQSALHLTGEVNILSEWVNRLKENE